MADESVTLRDPELESRAASTAYAQARAVLAAEPGISAAELVERLRQAAGELADAADGIRAERAEAAPWPSAEADREANRPGLGAAAALARDRMSRAVAPPSTPGDETAGSDQEA